MILILLALLANNSAARATVTLSIDDVAKRVSKANHKVYSTAVKVYQAKESIEVARMNLLPRLNVWRVAEPAINIGMSTGADTGKSIFAGVAALFTDIAPFLVPANWFRVDQQKQLFYVEQEAYRTLWANEIMAAKTTFINVLYDEQLLALIDRNRGRLDDLLALVRDREALGTVPKLFSHEVEVRVLGLDEDARRMRALLNEEKASLAFAVGIPQEEVIELKPIALPKFDEELDYHELFFRAVDTSAEIREYDHLIAMIPSIKREVRWNFLGTSSLNRGTTGNVFDNLPIAQGLGFATAPSLRVVESQGAIIKAQRQAIIETVKRQLKTTVEGYNLDIEAYRRVLRRKELTQGIVDQLYDRMRMGQVIEGAVLAEALRGVIDSETSAMGLEYRMIGYEEKIERLLYQGDYAKAPATIEALK